MNYELKKLSGLIVLNKEELSKVYAASAPDCEEGFTPDGNGGCVPIRTDGRRNNDRSPDCDTA